MEQNYHLQLPPPYNHIILGGAKPLTTHTPELYVGNDEEDKQMPGVPKFYAEWPASDVVGWKGESPAEFGKPENEGGVWTGGLSLHLVSTSGHVRTGNGRADV
jgi:hypothetical protein